MTKQPHRRSEAPQRPKGVAPKQNKAAAADRERQCLVTRERGGKAGLIRFVVSPDGEIVPDLSEKLPGRGFWVTAQRKTLDQAVAKRHFSKAAKAQVRVPQDLSDQLEALLARRCLSLLGQAHGAGLIVLGGANVSALLRARGAVALIEAEDGQPDGRRKMLGALKAGVMTWQAETESADAEPLVVGCLTSAQLSLALGRENVIHAALKEGGLSGRLLTELRRLGGFCPLRPTSWTKLSGANTPKNIGLSF